MNKKPTIAIYGGAFDPPHWGHYKIVRDTLINRNVDQVFVVPTYVHRFGKQMSPFEDRYNMCLRMFNTMRSYRGNIFVDDVEKDLYDESEGRTVNLIQHYRTKWGTAMRIALIIGYDNWDRKDEWYKFDTIMNIIDEIIIAPKGQYIERSTDIRKAIANNKPYDSTITRSSVLEYIENHELYREQC